MKKKQKMQMIMLCVSLLLIIISAIILGMALIFNKNEKKAAIVFSTNNNAELIIVNTTPLTDELGKKIDSVSEENKTIYSEFSISSNMKGYNKINYEIYVKEINNSTSISNNYIKVYLTDNESDINLINTNSNIIKTFDQLSVSSTEDAKILYKGTLQEGEVSNFKLRMWLADTYTVSNEQKSFEVELFVKIID